MQEGILSVFQVSIDFDESHLFFPIIILVLLAVVLLAILIRFGPSFLREIKNGTRKLSLFEENFDKFRLFGSLLLLVVYFIAMDAVGRLFPNMGFGFLFMSIPFMLLTSLLYVHNLDRKKMMLICVNSLVAPCIAWYVLGNMFNISLP